MILTASFAMLTVFTRYLDHGFTVAQQVYLRTAVAFALAVVIFARKLRWAVVVRAGGREWAVVVARTVLLYVVGTLLFAKAATLTSVANVSFIAALPLAAALGLLLRRVSATPARLACVAGSVVGVALLSGPRSVGAGVTVDPGDLLALLAMTAMAWSYLGRDWHTGVLNNHEITTLTLGVGTLGVALTSLAQGQGVPQVTGPVSPLTLWSAVAVAGILSIANVFLINYGFDRVDPVHAGNLLTLECLWGLLFGLLFYHQTPTLPGLLGGTLILTSALTLNTTKKPTP
ncbi:DMT family transporter [Nocardia sp. NPDC004068]|uniref:DMT family transporter n=1 Tax=Nocardia sp. NPDC004068 TaxID=3364303 RepID=UPI0036963C5B